VSLENPPVSTPLRGRRAFSPLPFKFVGAGAKKKSLAGSFDSLFFDGLSSPPSPPYLHGKRSRRRFIRPSGEVDTLFGPAALLFFFLFFLEDYRIPRLRNDCASKSVKLALLFFPPLGMALSNIAWEILIQ